MTSQVNRANTLIQQAIGSITRQRWFGDKAREVTSAEVEIAETVGTNGEQVVLAVVRFSFEWGADARYFVPFPFAGEPGADALQSEAFLRWYVDGFAEGRILRGASTWRWREIGDGLPDGGTVDFSRAKAISGEQSNTSIVFDGAYIGKMFRRVQPGLNPDLEIGEFLSTGNRFPHAPKLYGVVEVEHEEGPIAIAAMQEFVANQGDGWTWLLGQLRAGDADSIEALLNDVRLLARRTGELHVALASDRDDPSFAPEEFDSADAQALIDRVRTEINESVEGLVQHIPADEVEVIHKRMGDLMGHAWSMVGTRKIRVHGDYHLGQTLRTVDNDFVLIDFEGEPSRTMEQRRMKLPALKDVAGMVRSLDYAAATVLQDEQDPERRKVITEWLAAATDAYVGSYRQTIAIAPGEIAPQDDGLFQDALNLMIAEKALYEVRYELNNRPAWLSIPLNALRRLAGLDTSAEID
jgi:maltokinase